MPKNTQRKKIDIKVTTNSLASLVSGLPPTDGTGRQSIQQINNLSYLRNQVRGEFITSDRVLLSQIYSQYGIVRAAIEVPVLDAFRGGFRILAYKKEIPEIEPNNQKKGKILNKVFSFFSKNEDKKKEDDSNEEKELSIKTPVRKVDVVGEMIVEEYREAKKLNKEIDDETRKNEDEIFRVEVDRTKERELELWWRENGLSETIKQARIWCKLFGGAAIIINVPRKYGEPNTELDITKLQKGDEVEFIPCDNWELNGRADISTDIPNSINWMDDVPFTYNGIPLHKSRVIILKGRSFPSIFRAVGRGWGMSELEPVVRNLNKNSKNEDVIYRLMENAYTNVIGIQGFNESMMNDDTTTAILKRLSLGQSIRNTTSLTVMDAEDQFQSKQASFGGLSEIIQENRKDFVSDFRTKDSKLYGTSASGFNSGQADNESYNEKVEAEERLPLEPHIIKILKIGSRIVLGQTLDIDIQWNPLRTQNLFEDQKIKSLQLADVENGILKGYLTDAEAINIMNKYNLLGIEIRKKKIAANPLVKNVFRPIAN